MAELFKLTLSLFNVDIDEARNCFKNDVCAFVIFLHYKTHICSKKYARNSLKNVRKKY